MLKIFAVPLALLSLAGPAKADACDALVAQMENYMSNPMESPLPMPDVERLLEAGRAAKQSGNVQSCESAMTSPAPASPTRGGKNCEKSPNTV